MVFNAMAKHEGRTHLGKLALAGAAKLLRLGRDQALEMPAGVRHAIARRPSGW